MNDTSACLITKQHQRIDSIEKFIRWLPDIIRYLQNLPKSEDHSLEQMIEVIRNNIFNPRFSFWVLHDKDVHAKGFVAAYIATNLYGELFGETWLVSTEPGANTRRFINSFLIPWFCQFPIQWFTMINTVHTPAKERWLKSFKMHKSNFALWRRKA